ncbi:hypothetical protein BV25DRAFT_1915276 [Artomyces pyxidatus]|uniref:Uncharacterized protein n=1 Tax=Artomyces pyxidatus TaxID=48021 RepID=A0ACB8T3R4_9AGAM|nr:hypothetical protein BV25DRAFT_1915276 [Artomyces pyxidatus]
MLDFDSAYTPSYPYQYHDVEHYIPFPAVSTSPNSPNSYAPLVKSAPTPQIPCPATFVFDPFADEDSSVSSGTGGREREVQRLQKVEFLRQREWMRRVEAWVEGVNSGMTTSQAHPRLPTYTQSPYTLPADTPETYYSSSSSLAARSEPAVEEEPYVIYSTPLPNTPKVAAIPKTAPPPAPPIPTRRTIHSRYSSLSSIREEDEGRL